MRFYRLKIHIVVWIILVVIFALYVEIFSYEFSRFKWHSAKCINEKACLKILLVADPQIIGNKMEEIHFLTPISIYDSDRYLQKTYRHAYDFVKPDVVIFLGDLMDEGHIAKNPDFYGYVRRIFNIFMDSTNSHMHLKHIWIPGDNDIGGEDDLVTPEKLKRFERAFSQPSMITVGNITFFKINRLTFEVPVYKKPRYFYNDPIFVGLSHIPMMFKPAPFVDKVITKMLPQVIFSAHEHKSMIISTDASLRQEFHIIPLTPEDNKLYEFSLGETDMYEIMIPTCSYRMGTDKIGYGYAVIENKNLQFTVLWSPSRFMQLFSYLILPCLFLIYSILVFLRYRIYRCKISRFY